MGKKELEAAWDKARKDLTFLISRGIVTGSEFDRLQKILVVLMEKLAEYEEED